MSVDDRSTRYEGYSDYQSVSRSVAEATDQAVEAYALIQSHHSEGARVTPQIGAEASAHILGAALKLRPELDHNREQDEKYADILERWEGDDGFIEQLKRESLSSRCPEWLGTFVVDIRTAGFQLGYLKAGQETDPGPEDIVEREAEEMFD